MREQERFDFAAQFRVGAAGLFEVRGRWSGGSLTAALKMPLSDMSFSFMRIVAQNPMRERRANPR